MFTILSRRPILLSILAILAAIVIGALVGQFALDNQEQPDQLKQAGIILLPESRDIPAVTLTSTDNKQQRMDQLKGKWTLVFFGYTFCPDICPTTLSELRQIKQKLPKVTNDKLQVIMISVDPDRDTPEQLGKYLNFFDPAFIGYSGKMDDIQVLSSRMSIPFVPGDRSKEYYTVDHSGNLAILDPSGVQRGFIRAPIDIEAVARSLPLLVK